MLTSQPPPPHPCGAAQTHHHLMPRSQRPPQRHTNLPAFPVMGRMGGISGRSEVMPAWVLPSTQLTPPVSPSRHSKAGQCWRCGPLCWSSCQCWTPPSQTWGPLRGGAGCCWGLCASWDRILLCRTLSVETRPLEPTASPPGHLPGGLLTSWGPGSGHREPPSGQTREGGAVPGHPGEGWHLGLRAPHLEPVTC